MVRTSRLATGCLWTGLTLLAPRSLPAAAAERGVSLRLKVPGGRELPLYSESHALVIGASDYTNGWPSLPGVKDDLAVVKAALQRQGFQVTTLLNPTRADLDRSLRDFVSDHGQAPEARLVVYFAGHGHTLKTPDGRDLGYVVPVDAPLPKLDKGGFKKLAVSMNDVETVALQIESKHVLFLFDSCFSGSIFDVTRSVPDDISEKTARPVRQFITSGSADQTVPDRSEFRRQLVAALEGEGDLNRDGYVTGSELGQFLESKVTNYSHRSQTPQYGKIRYPTLDKGDFVFELPRKVAAEPARPAAAPQGNAPTAGGVSAETMAFEAWGAIKESRDPADFRGFLAMNPPPALRFAAESKLKQLSTPAKAPTPVPTERPAVKVAERPRETPTEKLTERPRKKPAEIPAETPVRPAPGESKLITVGIPLPLSGPEARFGEMEMQAYGMAIEEINARGGVKGARIALDIQDSGGRPETAVALVERFITEGKYPIVVGEYTSQCSYAVAGVAEKYRVPYLIVTGAADKITQQGWRYVFRLNPPASLYTQGLFSFFDSVARPRSIALLYENTDFGSSTSRTMKEYCESKGIQVLLSEGYQPGAVDFKPILQKIKAVRPELVYMVSYLMDASLLMRQARELELDAQAFVGGGAGHSLPEFLQNAGEAAEYCLSATLWNPLVKYPGAREFFDGFKATFGKEPDYHGAEAYAAAYVLADTLKRARTWSPEDLRAALAETDLTTAFGPVKFISWGAFTNQNRMESLVLQVRKKRFEIVWPRDAATAPAVYPVPRWRDRR